MPASVERLADGLLVVHHEPEMATVVRRLAAALLQREELVAQVDEGHVLAFPAQLEVEEAGVKRQRCLDIAHFKRHVIETDGARFFGFRHQTLTDRVLRDVR